MRYLAYSCKRWRKISTSRSSVDNLLEQGMFNSFLTASKTFLYEGLQPLLKRQSETNQISIAMKLHWCQQKPKLNLVNLPVKLNWNNILHTLQLWAQKRLKWKTNHNNLNQISSSQLNEIKHWLANNSATLRLTVHQQQEIKIVTQELQWNPLSLQGLLRS